MQKAQVLTEDPFVILIPICFIMWHENKSLYVMASTVLYHKDLPFYHLAVNSHEPMSTRTIPYLSLLPLGPSILPGNGNLEKYKLLTIHEVSYH